MTKCLRVDRSTAWQRSAALFITVVFCTALLLLVNRSVAHAAEIIDYAPTNHALGVDVSANISATFDVALNAVTVTTRTFTVRSDLRGLFTDSATVSGSTITLDPSGAFFTGEYVQVVSTAAIRSGLSARLKSTQWGFTAGPEIGRCVFGFRDLGLNQTQVYEGSAAWGDYDNDGDLDFVTTGYDSSNAPTTALYRNDSGAFTEVNAGLAAVAASSVAWGDYDNDGDLDLLLTGRSVGSIGRAILYRNDGGAFTDVDAGLTGVDQSSVAWGDYDNDGDLDALVMGTMTANDPSGAVVTLYRNNAGVFLDANAGLTNVFIGSATWADYDDDGDLDILLTGFDGGAPVTKLYSNNSGGFVDAGAGIDPVWQSSAAWGDYDNDGDIDLLLTGLDQGFTPATTLYRNDAGVFVDSGAALVDVARGSVIWGDYDTDGDLDILLTGGDVNFAPTTVIYRNDGGSFVDAGFSLTDLRLSSVAWGDYDNDSDLDILLTGLESAGSGLVTVFRNDGCADLTIAKRVTPTGAAPGASVAYSLHFSNSGPAVAYGAVVSDSIPMGFVVTGVTSSTIGSGVIITQTSGSPNFSWAVNDLALGEGGVITLMGTLNAALAPGAVITNTATITASNDVTSTNNSAEVAFSVLASLRVTRTGAGLVSSDPAGISCGGDCQENYPFNTTVQLTAIAATGSSFAGWGGACTGQGACTVTLDRARSVTATFEALPDPSTLIYLPVLQR